MIHSYQNIRIGEVLYIVTSCALKITYLAEQGGDLGAKMPFVLDRGVMLFLDPDIGHGQFSIYNYCFPNNIKESQIILSNYICV